MDAKLVVVGGDAKPTEIALTLPAILGRGRDATLALRHALVSRNHCEIFESDGYLVVRDMGSLNGTFVNNKQITEAVLPPGHLLTVGTVTFRAVYEPPEGAAEPPPSELAGAAPLTVQDVDVVEVEDVEEVVAFDDIENVEVQQKGTVTEFADFELVEPPRGGDAPIELTPDAPTTKDEDDLLTFADED
jgi:hypothetical protein